jgi:CO/xanthine dehydrogenase Mo-binding subunit
MKDREFKIVGSRFIKAEAHQKATGELKFSGDLTFPGMIHAKILRSHACKNKKHRSEQSSKVNRRQSGDHSQGCAQDSHDASVLACAVTHVV